MNLDEATAQFWEVKRAYNGRNPSRCQPMSTERALKILNKVLKVTGPHHPLTQRVIDLRDSIIIGD